MAEELSIVQGGTVTSPHGYLAGATYAGLKTYGEDKLDLGILLSERPAAAAGTFTTNRIKSSSVVLTQRHIAPGRARAVVVNSGCANSCVGEQGLRDAQETVTLAARKLGIAVEETLFCSTGLIGVELPMALIRAGLQQLRTSRDGGHAFARAILTTDSHPKEAAATFSAGGTTITVGGACKGSGMIHPNMATMLAFLTTDATVEPDFLRGALKEAVDASFNMLSVDGDSSTNDTVLILANGAAGGPVIRQGDPNAAAFQDALNRVCTGLAREIARDGEGATKLIEVTVEEAPSLQEARAAARTVVSSTLVKAAVHGNDPNWGRVLAAAGRSGVAIEEGRIALYVNDVCIMEQGMPIPFFKEAVVANMRGPEVRFRIRLGLGKASATAWGCDLSEEYVTFNSAYST
ncbi:MAG: bifunctional glutamate N-acetyltransferase/amino-acid acetyltransferase ArgJ [Chloroflexi bacterium]|nr:bifunctional glutamate N-acetyltransferase/amino-acid acetyltransferase ArgJ [Chloroflexota bacterium]